MGKKQFAETMRDIFRRIDKDRDNTISRADLQNALQDPITGAYFNGLGVNVQHISQLFKLLDTSGDRCVNIHEFMDGFHRLKGEAKSLDMALMHSDVNKVR